MTDNTRDESRTADFVVGRVVGIGDIEAIGNKTDIVIETTIEQLRGYGRNLVLREVEIRLKAVPVPNNNECNSPLSGKEVVSE
jgi:hypothetical protein